MVTRILMVLVVVYVWVQPIMYHHRTGNWFCNPVIIFTVNTLVTILWAIAFFAPFKKS